MFEFITKAALAAGRIIVEISEESEQSRIDYLQGDEAIYYWRSRGKYFVYDYGHDRYGRLIRVFCGAYDTKAEAYKKRRSGQLIH